jgi:hypothetical protein
LVGAGKVETLVEGAEASVGISVGMSVGGDSGVSEGVGGIEVGTNTCTSVGGTGVDIHAKEMAARATAKRANLVVFFITVPPLMSREYPGERGNTTLSILPLSGWVKQNLSNPSRGHSIGTLLRL